MPKILVFSGSNSSTSINQQLALYAAAYLRGFEIQVIHLKDYPAPVYSMDMEIRGEFPESMRRLNELFKQVDAMLISLPEYNGGITPVFKNTIDWISRIEMPILKNKPVCLLSTSPGKRGAQTNLRHISEVLIKIWGGKLSATFSLPNFDEHVVNKSLQLGDKEKKELQSTLNKFTEMIV